MRNYRIRGGDLNADNSTDHCGDPWVATKVAASPLFLKAHSRQSTIDGYGWCTIMPYPAVPGLWPSTYLLLILTLCTVHYTCIVISPESAAGQCDEKDAGG